jgi:hypothetical protein
MPDNMPQRMQIKSRHCGFTTAVFVGGFVGDFGGGSSVIGGYCLTEVRGGVS